MSISKKDLTMLQLQKQIQQQDLLKAYVESGHAAPKTRREFLSSGMMAFGATLFMPNLMQLIANSAWAADAVVCPPAVGPAMPAFINIQLNGGPAMFANHIVRGNGGSALPDYAVLGMGASPRIENLFGNAAPFWVEPDASFPASGMMRGFFRKIPNNAANNTAYYSKTAFIAVAAESIDDRATNLADLTGMLNAIGVTGSALPYLLTGYGAFLTEALQQPTNHARGAIIPSANLTPVTTAASLEAAVGFTGAMGRLPAGQPLKLINAIEGLSKKQVEALAANPGSHESNAIFRELMTCSTARNSDVLKTSKAVDPYSASYPNASAIQAIWAKDKVDADANAELVGKGLTPALMNSVLERCALATTNCLSGLSGAAIINLGGYDYHQAFYTRESASYKDNFFGDILARIIMTAKVFNRKVFIYVTADGSLNNKASSSATVNWSGDFFKRGMNYIFAYDPGAAVPTAGYTLGSYSDAAYQLNHFSDDHVVDNQNPLHSADAHDLCSAAVFLNYLNFAKKSSLIELPALNNVKKRLAASLPVGAGTIFDYYTRIKG